MLICVQFHTVQHVKNINSLPTSMEVSTLIVKFNCWVNMYWSIKCMTILVSIFKNSGITSFCEIEHFCGSKWLLSWCTNLSWSLFTRKWVSLYSVEVYFQIRTLKKSSSRLDQWSGILFHAVANHMLPESPPTVKSDSPSAPGSHYLCHEGLIVKTRSQWTSP